MEHGEEIELDVMTPHDRRIVHMALKDRHDVVTRSEGDEGRAGGSSSSPRTSDRAAGGRDGFT